MSAPSFEDALARWRATRHPRFAAIVLAIAAREPARAGEPPLGASGKAVDVAKWNAVEEARDWRDLPRLLALVAAGRSALALERVERLATWDDPRVVTALLELLEDPPFTAGSTRKLWQAVVAALEGSGDVRARDGMASLSLRYKTINDTDLGAWLAGAMSRAAAKMNEPPPLTAADEAQLAEHERALFGEVRAEPAPAPPARDDLFREIVESPDDDAARLVYADAASERGDPRGEFIVLQVERAAGRGTPERADLERRTFGRAELAAWSAPLGVAANTVTFERGFPAAVQLANTGLAQVATAREWGTVRRLTRMEHAPVKALLELLDGEHGRNLRDVGVVKPSLLAKLRTRELPWTHVTTRGDKLAPEHLERLPGLVHLAIDGPGAFTRALFAAAPRLESVCLTAPFEGDGRSVFGAIPTLRRIELRTPGMTRSEPRYLAGVSVRELFVDASLRDAAAWLDAVPTVTALDLDLDDTHWDLLRPLFDARPELATITLARRRGDLVLSRDGTITALLGPRWPRFYDELAAAAPVLASAGFARLVVEPEAPRHQKEGIPEATLAPLRAAWPDLELGERL
ncbi:MAG: TIGR02996 domain-containing protein [Labilithrix sp.]|nr:TIGR02996 domain-containing protein [Labilithrix sp.]MCW5815823.1 TIGR02996 domain-containing protein [Labilithrix sp.]